MKRLLVAFAIGPERSKILGQTLSNKRVNLALDFSVAISDSRTDQSVGLPKSFDRTEDRQITN